MLSSVVEQCLSMALASASRAMAQTGTRSLVMRDTRRVPARLAAYPRLAAVMHKAEAEGVLYKRGRTFQ